MLCEYTLTFSIRFRFCLSLFLVFLFWFVLLSMAVRAVFFIGVALVTGFGSAFDLLPLVFHYLAG